MRIKNFIRGMGSIFDIFPSSRRYDQELQELAQTTRSFETDAENIRNDWIKVGNTLRHVMEANKPKELKRLEAHKKVQEKLRDARLESLKKLRDARLEALFDVFIDDSTSIDTKNGKE